MIAAIPSATLVGVEGTPVSVEVHVASGLPGCTIVGQPDAACRESRDRVRAALMSSDLPWPMRRMTVNLAPTSVRKVGAGLDLAIAVGVLVASGEIPVDAVTGVGFIGELGLDGTVRHVPGVINMAEVVDASTLVVPVAGAAEAELVGRHKVRAVRSLREVVDALRADEPWPDPVRPDQPVVEEDVPDLAEVRGQELGRWAVEVAAAGGHHLLLTGPPGAGKSMLAKRLPGLMPTLDVEQALETTRVHSAAGLPLPPGGLIERPPFRSPHHTISYAALIGGGSAAMRPGEISLATNGILFVDEIAEVPAYILDCLRQPLEEGRILVCRARASVTFPARFLLVGAMNPCPCGQGQAAGGCTCSDASRQRYERRLSGPLLDRFDLRIPVTKTGVGELMGGEPGESSAVVAARVAEARAVAATRGIRCNAELPAKRLDEVAPLTTAATRILEHKLQRGELSARGLHRIRRVARTLADLAGAPQWIDEDHVCAALELRVESRLLARAS